MGSPCCLFALVALACLAVGTHAVSKNQKLADQPAVVQVSSSKWHLFNCFRFSDMTGRCIGSNDSGQLGQGNTDSTVADGVAADAFPNALTPAIALGGRLKHIEAGGLHACAIRMDDKLVCWGSNNKACALPHAPVPPRLRRRVCGVRVLPPASCFTAPAVPTVARMIRVD